jgi:hypothetical protein
LYPQSFPQADVLKVVAFLEGQAPADAYLLQSAYNVLGFGLSVAFPVSQVPAPPYPLPSPPPPPGEGPMEPKAGKPEGDKEKGRCRVEAPPDKAEAAKKLKEYAGHEGENAARHTQQQQSGFRGPPVSPSVGAPPKPGGPMQSPHERVSTPGQSYGFSPPSWLVPLAIQVIEEVLRHVAG